MTLPDLYTTTLHHAFHPLHPYDTLTWETRTAEVRDFTGEVLQSFPQVEVPAHWSTLASNILASKYFRQEIPTSARKANPPAETSLKQVIDRVVQPLAQFGQHSARHIETDTPLFQTEAHAKVFELELTSILVGQRAAFNSPVWFNAGLHSHYGLTGKAELFFWNPDTAQVEPSYDAYTHPQCSACFIQSVNDELLDLFRLMTLEAKLFKYGSGSGTNFSTIRGYQERLAGGGHPSGLMSFLDVFDRAAGATKSGGTTRRAAKMVCLDMDHPEIHDFIWWKAREEQKAFALMDMGYDGRFEGEAYRSVSGQNANLSVRLTGAFMAAVEAGELWQTRFRTTGEVCDTYDTPTLFGQIAKAAWRCADPGVQFHDTIQTWHTCPNTGPIRASNPCSEYHFLDDSACNLASVNLVQCLDVATQRFDLQAYAQTCQTMFIAQELIVDYAGYPSEAIAQNSHDFRPLGLGFANLGSLLMRLGLPYDSALGRAWAATLAAVMGGVAYYTSAQLAQQLGPFPRFAENREPMLGVIQQHLKAAEELSKHISGELQAKPANSPHQQLHAMAQQAVTYWQQALALGSQVGFRNAQATVIAPTGTIGLFMDCDTTGIEPEFSLVKWKQLSGGGYVKILNQAVTDALGTLGYKASVRQEILDYFAQHDTVNGCPALQPAHAAVFDCATPAPGDPQQRFLSADAHLQMMAAVQPFISGAISKTVNLPHTATPETIAEIYHKAWKLGLKCVSVYRDGSKGTQPLNTQALASTDSGVEPNVYETAPPTNSEVPRQQRQPLTQANCPQCGRSLPSQAVCTICPGCGYSSGCSI